MSIDNVRAAIERFLLSDKPQVLCIRGAWGTGKTYTWDDVLKEVADTGRVKAKKYAKASLFGLNSIKELKREIYLSAIDIDKIGKPFDISNVKEVGSNLLSGAKSIAKMIGFLQDDALTAMIEVAATYAREHLILIDDLERKGEDLRSVDVLGYIALLRDDRACKVTLLLNDEELEDGAEFSSYLEKVVDVYIRFQPSREEIANIAIRETDEISALVRSNAVALGISNVRVIRKILELVKDVQPLLAKYSGIVTTNAAATITLLGWSCFQPKSAPPLDYLKRVNTYSPNQADEKQDLLWRDLLLEYHYTSTSEFDLVLLKGIENGYFDEGEIDKHAAELHLADERDRVQKEMRVVWDDVHYSFTKPAEGILDRLFGCYVHNIEFMTIADMSALEALFREMEDKRSEEVVARYIEVHRDTPGAFDFDQLYQFGHELPDAVREKITAARAAQTPKLSPDDIVKALATRGGHQEIFEAAAKLPVAEYVRIFKAYEGKELSDILSGLRQYLTVGSLNSQTITIMDNAGQALRLLAAESPMNKRRAMRLGLIQRLDLIEAENAAQADKASSNEEVHK
ncbi:hypothetical protein [Rhizobium leguminosarum]|uniref:hypothetical protein n=1 Tax=Rhizobium leguminosarum TaxID=384 RepID=UPI001030DD77|nr:hypothetical protein [Rhizobium leguminosarum]TAX26343.1 hypothetical protein ELI06_24640 [Rhizobium leguminosarum]